MEIASLPFLPLAPKIRLAEYHAAPLHIKNAIYFVFEEGGRMGGEHLEENLNLFTCESNFYIFRFILNEEERRKNVSLVLLLE